MGLPLRAIALVVVVLLPYLSLGESDQRFIVSFKGNAEAVKVMADIEMADKDEQQDLFRASKMKPFQIGRLEGVVFTGSEGAAESLALDPRVESVEADGRVYALESTALYGLDRVDQEALPLNGRYDWEGKSSGSGVRVYVIDSGIRIDHTDFAGRAEYGWDFVDWDGVAEDPHGHGTHCASTAVGQKWGVAKEATAVGVRVLGADGSGWWSDVIAGIEWSVEDSAKHEGGAVLSLSLGGGKSSSVNLAIAEAYAEGVISVVAAGNEAEDACNSSPASEPLAVTVGASEASDDLWYWTNFGPCVDIFAPGSQIYAADAMSQTAGTYMSGTSMATPHVAGGVALLLEAYGSSTPVSVIVNALYSGGASGHLSGNLNGAPNLILQTSAAWSLTTAPSLPQATSEPTDQPTLTPEPTSPPIPTPTPTFEPSAKPTLPTSAPTEEPTAQPVPTEEPTSLPTITQEVEPTPTPTKAHMWILGETDESCTEVCNAVSGSCNPVAMDRVISDAQADYVLGLTAPDKICEVYLTASWAEDPSWVNTDAKKCYKASPNTATCGSKHYQSQRMCCCGSTKKCPVTHLEMDLIDATHAPSMITNAPSPYPSPYPTAPVNQPSYPTPFPSFSPTITQNCQGFKKRKCKKKPECAWKARRRKCISKNLFI